MPIPMNLRVTLVQTALDWENPVANRARFDRLLQPLGGSTDLVVLPEMFTTGFSMEPERLAEQAGGPTTQWLAGQARRLDAAVCGSVMTLDGGRCVNRLLFATPDGRVARYDKRHLFRMGQEHEHYSAGNSTLVVEFRGWRIAPLVCYDLRFPVWSRRRPGYEYDLLVYVANWPARRSYAWRQLLIARAIENQCCVAGVNRVGEDGEGVVHDGGSAVHDALGAALLEPGSSEAVVTAALDREALLQFREKFPAQLDADAFQLG
jgi:predicted amidohydrolase